MDQPDLTRRDALRTGAGLIAVGAVGSTAGCLDSIPFVGGGANYTSWIPAADEFQEDENLSFSFSNNNTFANNEDNFDSDYWDQTEQDVDALDIDFEDITFDLSFGPYQIYDGNYDQQTVIDALEDDDTGRGEYDEEGEYEGYTVYLPDNVAGSPRTAYGVNGTTVVRASATREEDDAEGVLEIAIDTDNGNETRFVDDNEDFGLLTDELGSGTTVSGSVSEDETEDDNPEFGQFEGAVGSGSTLTVNGENSNFKYVVIYDSESDTDQAVLEDFFDEALDDFFDPDGDPSYNTNGRVATIKFSFPTDELGN
jgi:hypothetical protein